MAGGERSADPRPNIIWIMSDDLSWRDLGCLGQTKITTPNIDRLAARGITFTSCYSGSTVSAPSRSSLMQGLHQGHATVRSNMLGGYRHSLQPDDVTVAEVMKGAGYATGLFGKWGLSNHDQPGVPNAKGFDEFSGYLNQRHAHDYYPTHLWRNRERVAYPQHQRPRDVALDRYDDRGELVLDSMRDPASARYSFDVYCEDSLAFVREHADGPFFMYLAYTPPHGKLVVPSLGEYADLDWPSTVHKVWAAMVTRMDAEVGRLIALLDELAIRENTLIFFCSDNGYSPFGAVPRRLRDEGVPDLDGFFGHRGPFRGGKGDLREGGLRVPMIAHWPRVITEARESDLVWAFWDLMPTAAELAGAECPRTDGVSVAPTLKGDAASQAAREFLYWEFLGAEGLEQAVRIGPHRAWRANAASPTEVYDVEADSMEERDLAAERPEVAREAEGLFGSERESSPYFPDPGESKDDWLDRARREGTELPENVNTF